MKPLKKKDGKTWFFCPCCEEWILLEPAGVGSIGDMGVECKSCYEDRMQRYYKSMMTEEGGE